MRLCFASVRLLLQYYAKCWVLLLKEKKKKSIRHNSGTVTRMTRRYEKLNTGGKDQATSQAMEAKLRYSSGLQIYKNTEGHVGFLSPENTRQRINSCYFSNNNTAS